MKKSETCKEQVDSFTNVSDEAIVCLPSKKKKVQDETD